MKNKFVQGPGIVQYQFDAGLMVFVWDNMPQTALIEGAETILLIGPAVEKAVRVQRDENKENIWNTVAVQRPIALWIEVSEDKKAFVERLDQKKYDEVIQLIPNRTGERSFRQLEQAFSEVTLASFPDV
jgi:hypothetical protein